MHRCLAILGLCLAAACASPPSAPPAPPPPPVAPPAAELARSGLAVAVDAEVKLTDAARKREIAVAVTYPGGEGPFPVIVFSHGDGGSAKDLRPLLRFWATRGYAVLAPSHADPPPGKGASDPKAWENRARDLAFVIDSLPQVSSLPASGHSYGAYSAGLLAGATVDVPKGEKGRSFADSRPKAFLLLSPPGEGTRGWTKASWANVARPVMVVTGSRDQGAKGQDPSWRFDACRLSPPGDKFCLLLKGASHLSFIGKYAEPGASLSGRGKGAPSAEGEVAIFKDVKAASVAFWDAYLKGDAAAKVFLESDTLSKDSGGRATLERR